MVLHKGNSIAGACNICTLQGASKLDDAEGGESTKHVADNIEHITLD